MATFPCPCCGYLTSSSPGSYDICPVCGWEDDLSQLRFANSPGGANRLSLRDAQRNFAEHGFSDPELVVDGKLQVQSAQGFTRDPSWRALQPADVEEPEPGVDSGTTYPADAEQLYYWRPTFWRR
ncbi:MAG TPA: CPCC family cysteine-rich protein [Actinomycetota bacterium]|jgi:hypothetical protein